ncbi:uncharacterized protein LOC135432899 isoform X2 [Drosophila montana]|uniref:uncharacterized protein LOC135432899 isoform X2 n=1 Tax=Drosophila montana TaxID=40370 RepID=UPI00313B44B5
MDFNNDKKQRSLGPSFLLERKQRISIEGRGDMYIKNTQTQVRELYRREALNEPCRSSSSHTDSQLLKTSLEVKALHKKIEREIGKLKNFRYSFLKDDQSPVQKQKPAPSKATVKHLHWRQKILRNHKGRTFDESPTSSNRQELQSIGFSSPDTGDRQPYFRTMCVASSPKSSAGEEVDSNRANRTAVDCLLDENSIQPEQKINRMCGGCVYGHCDDMSRPCSIYQSDYCQYGGASFCPQCSSNSYRTCDMPEPVPVPYSPDPLYQYPAGIVCQKQDSMMSSCTCSRPSCSRRKTDLNTDKFCRNWCPDPLSKRDRSPKAKDHFLSRSPSPRPQTRRIGKEKGKSESPSKYPTQKDQRQKPDKVMKISFRKQQSELSKTKPAKDKMIIKAYVAAQAPAVDSYQMDDDKLRMHREYMEMYRREHEKTAGKDSSISTSELGISPTYTKLPVRESTSAKHCRSFTIDTSTSRQVTFAPDQCKYEDSSEAAPLGKICQDTVAQTVVSKSCMQQMANSSSVEYESCEAKADKFQKRTLSVRRNDIVKTVSSCQTDEVVEDLFDDCSSYVDGAGGVSQWQLAQQPPSMSNQSSQTSPKIAGPSVSSYISQSRGIIRKQTTTQTDNQSDSQEWQECPEILTHDQLLSLNQENAAQRSATRRNLGPVSEQPIFSVAHGQSHRKVVQSDPVIWSPRAEFGYDNIPISAAERPEAFQSQAYVQMQNSPDTTRSPREFAYDNGPISAAERPEAFQSQAYVQMQNSPDTTRSPREFAYDNGPIPAAERPAPFESQAYDPIQNSPDTTRSPREFAYDNGPIPAAERPAPFESQAYDPIQNSPDTTRSPREFVPWDELTNNSPQSHQICSDSSGVRQKEVDYTEEVYEDCNCPGLTPVNTDRSNRNVDYGNQQNLPLNLTATEYGSLSEYPHFDSINRLEECAPFEDTTAEYDSTVEELSNTRLSMQERSPSPIMDATLTLQDQDAQHFNLCDDSQYIPQLEEPCASEGDYFSSQQQLIHNFESPCEESYDREQLAIREQSAQSRCTVRERRTRSVTFEDESGFSERSNTVQSCRSVVDWERVPQQSMSRDIGSAQKTFREDFPDGNDYADDGSPMDSYRSSSTAGTEFTCNESNYEDDYITCNEARTEREIPPFNGCPCMYEEYLKLVGMCKPRPYGGLNSWILPD